MRTAVCAGNSLARHHRLPRPAVLAAGLAGVFLIAPSCGGGVPSPALEGRDAMLSKTAVAQKCEEAAKGHDRPFVVEWDATDLASFEAKAAQRTLLVRYEGCQLEVLYECNDPASPTAFGSYGAPHFTSGTVQGFDVKNEGELYANLPLGAAKLSGRVQGGETLHLKYFVSGVATSSRDAIYQGDLKSVAGCKQATHFVWAYNLGAFELSSTQATSGSAEAGYLGASVGGSKKNEESSVSQGGTIGSCSTQDQRACRVPIRLALRKISQGSHPAGAIPGPGGATPGGAAALPGDLQEQKTISDSVSALLASAQKKLWENRDGKGCLADLDQVMRLDPRRAEHIGATRERCLMRAGRCDEGMKDMRARIASEDVKRLKTDEALDKEVRSTANMECSSAEAKNDADFVTRAAHELGGVAKANDGKECKARFDVLEQRILKLDRKDQDGMRARQQGISALEAGAECVARAQGCKAGLDLWTRKYRLQLPGMSGVDKTAAESWDTLTTKLKRVDCK